MKTNATQCRAFDNLKDAQAFADSQAGKTFHRYWSVEEMVKNTEGFQEALDEGQPWAIRLLKRWEEEPLAHLAYAEEPADVVAEGKDGLFYVGVALVEETFDTFDCPQAKVVTNVRVKIPVDPEAVAVDGKVLEAGKFDEEPVK